MMDGLTPREVADELGVTVRTVQRWIADGRLPVTHVGARVRVSRSSLSAVTDVAPAGREIRRLLVANRGEIVTRVARTARRMGIHVIGVHAADERPADGVDESHAIDSYLDGDALIRTALLAAADAVHPGYGFLAENPSFAERVVGAGLAWVGPPAAAIAAMGDKAAARRGAAAVGAPTVPGYDGAEQDDDTLERAAQAIGFPLLVKPTAGGGGKGMRVVHAHDSLRDALDGARREASRAFGDDRLILERYLGGSRHVEMQVVFDEHGNGVHLGERDCSAQRRNQKIVEEAPAPSVTPELRARMGEAATRVTASVGYANVGTVEMLLADSGEFYFLEMNARLQVEHAVTEAVTGRDLVEDQLRIAAGVTLAELGFADSPPIDGHAIEARIYAEDPESEFLPATGVAASIRWPEGVRIDAGVRPGDAVTDRYDPMIAKVIAHGADRDAALDRLRAALAETTVLGVRTNLRFLRWLLDQPAMRDGEMRTDTITALDVPSSPFLEDRHWAAAARTLRPAGGDPWSDGWRLNAPAVVRIRHGDDARSVAIDGRRQGGGSPMGAEPEAVRIGDTTHVDVDGQSLEFDTAPPPSVEDAVRHASAAGSAGSQVLVAPMPGRVIAVQAREGEAVTAREPIVVIEAMKMEHAVVAPIDGTLVGLTVAEGDQIERGKVLGEVAAYHDADG